MQTAERAYGAAPGTQVQMVRVGENHGGTQSRQIIGIKRFDRGERADGHELRRFNNPVRRGEPSAACGAFAMCGLEMERHVAHDL